MPTRKPSGVAGQDASWPQRCGDFCGARCACMAGLERVDAVEKAGRESRWGLAVGLIWQV
jgi:hypothetical protein